MKKWLISEVVDGRSVQTAFTDGVQAQRLSELLKEADAIFAFYSIDGGMWELLNTNDPQKIPSGFETTSQTSDSFNDHSGLQEHSTMEDAYNKSGRL